jgi:hypothetical protein
MNECLRLEILLSIYIMAFLFPKNMTDYNCILTTAIWIGSLKLVQFFVHVVFAWSVHRHCVVCCLSGVFNLGSETEFVWCIF